MDDKRLTDKWLRDLEGKTHKLVDQRANGKHERVKIAILDSGIDGSLEVFQNARTRINGIKSWVSQIMNYQSAGGIQRSVLKECQDDIGHGTHLTALILRVCPWARVYIARIVDAQGPKQELVAEVIVSVHRKIPSSLV